MNVNTVVDIIFLEVMLFQSVLERTISRKCYFGVKCYWLLPVTVMSETGIVQLRESGKLPYPLNSVDQILLFLHMSSCVDFIRVSCAQQNTFF